MGLDMYLAARKSLYSSEYHTPDKDAVTALRALDILKGVPTRDDGTDAIEIKIDLMYWRKANHIHAWFVENVQKGQDDCGNYYVEREQLVALDKLCAEVVMSSSASVAEEKLPCSTGFFFGGTDYDEWYFAQTKDTMVGLQKLLELSKPGGPLDGWSFEYHSSW